MKRNKVCIYRVIGKLNQDGFSVKVLPHYCFETPKTYLLDSNDERHTEEVCQKGDITIKKEELHVIKSQTITRNPSIPTSMLVSVWCRENEVELATKNLEQYARKFVDELLTVATNFSKIEFIYS